MSYISTWNQEKEKKQQNHKGGSEGIKFQILNRDKDRASDTVSWTKSRVGDGLSLGLIVKVEKMERGE